jgi:hypothetical protein
MAQMSDAQARLVARLARTQRWARIGGFLLVLVGVTYASWGVLSFDAQADPREKPGFDRPIARLAFLYQSYQGAVGRIQPETPTEQALRGTLISGMKFSAGVLMLLLRLFLGTLAAVIGLAALTVFVERRRLLTIIGQLRR